MMQTRSEVEVIVGVRRVGKGWGMKDELKEDGERRRWGSRRAKDEE
jgi:predicted AAA+ superfamily ATPase